MNGCGGQDKPIDGSGTTVALIPQSSTSRASIRATNNHLGSVAVGIKDDGHAISFPLTKPSMTFVIRSLPDIVMEFRMGGRSYGSGQFLPLR